MNTRIRQIRKAAKLTQIDFGKRLGISGGAVSKLESGENLPSDQTIKLICSEFGINPEWLRGVDGSPMKLPYEDATLAAVIRAMESQDEDRKLLVRMAASMPDDLLHGLVEYLRENFTAKL